jgi:uncharacterized RDD family membrane protein YckC
MDDQNPLFPQFAKADPIQRLAAGIIDLIVIGMAASLLSFIPYSNYFFNPLMIAYFLLRDSLPFLEGKSIGKTLIGLRVVREADNSKITDDYGLGIIRNVLFFIPLVGIIDAFMIFSQERKRFGDRWAKTIVVVDKKTGNSL